MNVNITSLMIKELRQRTGVGMSKCKNALVRSEGNVDKAIELLRKEGMASASKKEDRIAKEGLIGFEKSEDLIGMVELSCETDFVAQNKAFTVFLQDIVKQIIDTKPSSLDELNKQKFIVDETLTVDEFRNILIQKFGEKIEIKRMEVIKKEENSSYGIYSHMNGKIVR